MKVMALLTSSALLAAGALSGGGFGYDGWPFERQFGRGLHADFYFDRNTILEDSVCEAIFRQEQLALIVETKSIVNSKEMQIVQKRLVVDPYSFGIFLDKKSPFLTGRVVSEELVKEVTVKFGSDRFNEQEKEEPPSLALNNEGETVVDLSRVTFIENVLNSHFDSPEGFKGLQDKNVKIICQLPVEEKSSSK